MTQRTPPDGTPPERPSFTPPAGPYTEWSADDLEAAVRYYDHVYWIENRTEIPDERYDRYVKRLEELRPDSEVLQRIGPARAAAEEVGALGETVVHTAPMLSLDKGYTAEELGRWAQNFEGDVVVSPKVDGVAASLRYGPDGRLQVAATRGDGERGEDFTANARLIPDIPAALDPAAFEGAVEVRGEVYMTLSTFARHADEAANPRNLTAGTIKRKQASREQLADLSFFAYDLLGVDLASEWDKMQRLEALGFRTVEPLRAARGELQAAFDAWLARRDDLDYEVDGVVFKADDLAEQRRLGATAHHPRYALAYKFQGDSGESVLRAVEWSVARTGAITPVAIIEPVRLSGAMVSRCSLHNLNILRQHALHVGDTVVAMRRGGVIPNIELSKGGGDEEVTIPADCPACGRPTRIEGDVLYCSDPPRCRGVRIGIVEHYVKAVDIEGFGRKLLEQLYDAGLVRDPVDLYALTPHRLVDLERVGDVLARKLVANVDAARTIRLAVFLRALGVDELGRQVSALLEEHFGALDRIRALTVDELVALHGIGEVIAREVVHGLADRAGLIDRLLEHVTVTTPAAPSEAAAPEGPLAGRSVVFTGKLSSMDRKEAQRRAQEAGGKTPSGVTKDLDLLVIGDEGSPLLGPGTMSSKHRKAEKYNADGAGIEIISETEFLRRLDAAEADERG